MNSLWIQRMCAYRNTPLRLESANRIVSHKVLRTRALLRAHRIPVDMQVSPASTIEALLLEEARCARIYWTHFRQLVSRTADFPGRMPHGNDPINRLLDIGYHHLAGIVGKQLAVRELSVALGLFHVAHAADSAPLVYDLMELFRADVVDASVLRYVRLKKVRLPKLENRDIPQMLHALNQRIRREHFITVIGGCQTYEYYIGLQIDHFAAAINHSRVFEPITLPDRHDSRCP